MNEQQPNPDDKLTIAEAAAETRLSRSSIYDAVSRKTLAHYRLSGSGRRGKILIRRSDLYAWVESQKVEAGGGPPAPAGFTHRRR
jgi:excisionase family DNA binding protein